MALPLLPVSLSPGDGYSLASSPVPAAEALSLGGQKHPPCSWGVVTGKGHSLKPLLGDQGCGLRFPHANPPFLRSLHYTNLCGPQTQVHGPLSRMFFPNHHLAYSFKSQLKHPLLGKAFPDHPVQ